jgi:excisionase family DNA binding protein
MAGPLTVTTVAKALGCHPITVYRWVDAGTIPFSRIGSRIKFDPPTIADWLDRRSVA